MLLELTEGWTVRAVRGPIPDRLAGISVPADVPGCVHLDLLAAGHIPDPYLDENERELAWIGRTEWRYSTSFEWVEADGDQVELVAAGLDTVATVWLNDVVIAETANMHRSYRIALSGLLRAGRNDLAISFAAGVDAAQQASKALGPRPHVNEHPFNAIRKMAANFGWDWGPELVTAGIWRPISIESWRGARIASVRPLATVDGTTGTVRAHVDVQRAAGGRSPLRVQVAVAGRQAAADLGADDTAATVALDVPDVALWWPHGYGEQPLYPVAVTLSEADATVDDWQGRVGFRTVHLDTAPDEYGTRFALQVNGIAVFSRGVNWIPEDCFPSRVDRDRYAERLGQARGANVNLVRVWGGGIYESEDFYDVCDELGLLVWQDFLFACAAYAEEEPLRGEVIAEAREAVTRLCPHPSLAIWNGGNENIWGHADWGWQHSLAGRSWGWGYYTEVLPAIVADLDPTRPYSPGCPYSLSPRFHPNDPAHGTTHIWDVWNQLDYTAYRDYLPRFVAEFGFQGPPTWTTLTRAVHDDPLRPESPGMLAHQKAEDGQDKLARGLKAHLPSPETIDDWHWATSLNQARAVAFGIDHLRSCSPVCMGAVVWQLNDCWPVTSWSAVDGDGRRKPMWYAMRRSFRDRLLTLQPRETRLALVAVNDGATAWRAGVRVSRRRFDGNVAAVADLSIELDPRGSTFIELPEQIAAAADPPQELLVVESDGERAWWFFADDVDSALPTPQFDCRTERVSDGYRVVVTARTMLRDLAVLADRVAADAVVDDMLVSLLPGESATFHVRTRATVDPGAFTDPRVLRCANQLLHPDVRAATVSPP
jgi:beta-mannosidase